MKKLSRRKFIISSAKGAAGLGIIGGCNKSIVHSDIRPPSAPKGLTGFIEYYGNNNIRAILEWSEHDFSDIAGTFSEIDIKGYNVYKFIFVQPDPDKEGVWEPVGNSEINQTLINFKEETYTDETEFEENKQYGYKITAVDIENNESPASEIYSILVQPPGLIYKVTDENASSNNVLDATVIKTMLNSGILALTGKNTIAEAYNFLFPNIDSTTKIGIKINTLAGFLNGGLCTHPKVVEAIVDGLKQTSIAVNNIIVFDDRTENIMKGGNYTLQNAPDDYQILSTYGETDKFGNKNWSTTTTSITTSVNQRFSKIVEDVKYIINVPVLKNHSSAGITFALKNFFGIIDNPGNMHTDSNNPNKTWCDPYVAKVYEQVADKVKLIVGDAILGAEAGGPSTQPRFKLNTLLLGEDPVAMDMYALDLINAEREKNSQYLISTSQNSNYPTRADARHIVTAESTSLGYLNKKVIEVSL